MEKIEAEFFKQKKSSLFGKTSKSKSNFEIFSKKKKEEQYFFIVDQITYKTYLIKSNESDVLISVINFYISKSKSSINFPNLLNNSLIHILESVEPYYSGMIDVASCKKSDSNDFHSDLKKYSFKKYFAEIKSSNYFSKFKLT